MDRTEHVLDLIDGALRGDTSGDAMRWVPEDERGEPEPEPAPAPEPPRPRPLTAPGPTPGVVVVMVGGPLHGKALRLPCSRSGLPMCYLTPSRVEPVDYLTSLDSPEIESMTLRLHTYNLRWYNAPNSWSGERQQPAYVCMDEPAPIQLPDHPTEEDFHYARVAETLLHHAVDEALPNCVVPGCTDKGRYTFTAAEHGRLAGRDWQPGDEIRICPRHGHDIYCAQGVYGLDQLADWLRPDARYDALDAFDIGTDLLYGDQIRQSRARMLNLARRQP